MAKQLFFIEVTDVYGGEANYSWVTRHVITASTRKGAVSKFSRLSSMQWHDVGCDRYDSKSGATCYFIRDYDAEQHGELRLNTDERPEPKPDMVLVPMAEIKDFYSTAKPAGHWFDRDSMKFFKTKLPRVAYRGPAGLLFVTQETNPSNQTRFTVRRQAVTGDIETVGEFHHYLTRALAMDEVRRLHTV